MKKNLIKIAFIALTLTKATNIFAEFSFDFEKKDREKVDLGSGAAIDWKVIHHLFSAPLKTIPETPRLIKQGQYDMIELVQAGYKKAENKNNKCLDDKTLLAFFASPAITTVTPAVSNVKMTPAKCALTNLQQKKGFAQMNAVCNWNLGIESKLGVFQYDAVVHTSETYLKVEIKRFRLLNSEQKIPFAFDYAHFQLKKTNDCIPDSIKRTLSGAGAGLFKLPTK